MLRKLSSALRYAIGLSSLRCRLLVLVAFALLPLWGIVGYSLIDRRDKAISDASQQSQTVVRLALHEQQRLIDQAEQLLAVLARVPSIRMADPNSCSRLLTDLLDLHPLFLNIARVSATGDPVCNARALPDHGNVGNRAFFRRAVETRSFAVSEYLIGRTAGRATIDAGYPVLDDTGSAANGIVLVTIDSTWLSQLLTASQLPAETAVSLINAEGLLLARYPDDGQPIGQPLSAPELVRTVLAGEEGTARLNGADGVLRLFAFAPLGGTGERRGFIAVGIPMEVLVGPAQRQLGRGSFGLGLFTLIILGIAWAGAELLVLRRLRRLIAATRRLAGGDLSARTGFRDGRGEINELAHAFDGMAAALQQREADSARAQEEVLRLNTELEERVLERTAQLEGAYVELSQRETELREAKAFLEHLIEATQVALFRADPATWAVTYISANAARVLGFAAQQFTESPGFWLDALHPDDRAALTVKVAGDLGAQAGADALELRMRRPDGEYRWLLMEMSFEYDDYGGPASVLGLLIDVTTRKQAEAERELAQHEAERANQAKSEFLSRMSHELRTPLNAILGFSQLLELDELTEEQEESVAQILKGGRHLLDLINEVLDISRIEAGRLNLSPEPVQASDVLTEAVDLLRPLAAERRITLTADLTGPAQRYVLADRQRLKQVVLNLLSNAVKYNREAGSVTVTCTETPGRRLRITVADTGVGIPAALMGQVFSPFERLGAEHTEVQGTGLGLALSKRLMEAMDGAISVQSEAGVGSSFSLELPMVVGPEERLDGVLDALGHIHLNGNGARAKILYIEDNLSNLRLIERLLSRWPEVTLLTAMQGQLGLDLAREHQPDVVLLDLHLPDLLGDQVLLQLLADPRTQQGAVVMVSADATPGQVTRLLESGATAYLTKPIDVKQFYDVIEHLLKEKRG